MKRFLLLMIILVPQLLGAGDKTTTLWYRQDAKDWNEALPVGNGRIGAMVYGNPWNETIQLNEESLWAGCPEDGNAPSAAIMPELQQLLLDGKVPEAFCWTVRCRRLLPWRTRVWPGIP